MSAVGLHRATLSRSTLDTVARRGIRVPTAHTDGSRPSVAHLGTGVFHRAHQAIYANDLIAAGHTAAGIVGIAMHRPDIRDVLDAQDSLYAVAVVGATGLESCQVVGAIREMTVLAEAPSATVARLCDPAIRTVTMTITEDGYHWSSATSSLDFDDQTIRDDIATPGVPRTMPGLLVAALARRRSDGVEPFTVVPCDNLVGNGAVTRKAVVQFAGALDRKLARWIDETVPFCSTMVDRMVPATTPASRHEINAALGVDDRWPIATEAFSQWVLEPAPGARLPSWGDVGVEVVGDVTSYETLKLRVLNATHSAIACIGFAVGHELVSDAIADRDIRAFVDQLLTTEILPSVDPPPGVDIDAYACTVLERFANPALEYTTAKVASGGSHKIVQRLLPIVRSSLESGRPTEGIAFVIAAWLYCLAGPLSDRREVTDPLADRIVVAPPDHDSAAVVRRLRDCNAVLGDLTASADFVETISRSALAIWTNPRAALHDAVTAPGDARNETST